MRTCALAKKPSSGVMYSLAAIAVALLWGPSARAADFNVIEYIAKGYSSMGPIKVDSMDTKTLTLTLYSQPKKTKKGLTEKTVSVLDVKKRKLSLAALTKGTRVYVLQKSKEVLIIVLTAKEARNDQ
jgi:hypothetical protein